MVTPKLYPTSGAQEGRSESWGRAAIRVQPSPMSLQRAGSFLGQCLICPSGSSLRLSLSFPRGPGGLWISLRWGSQWGAEEPAHLAGMALMGFL